MAQSFDNTARRLAARLGLSAAHCLDNAAMYGEIADTLTHVYNDAVAACAAIANSQKEGDTQKRDAMPDDGWKDKLEWSRQTAEQIENNIRALRPDTPTPLEAAVRAVLEVRPLEYETLCVLKIFLDRLRVALDATSPTNTEVLE